MLREIDIVLMSLNTDESYDIINKRTINNEKIYEFNSESKNYRIIIQDISEKMEPISHIILESKKKSSDVWTREVTKDFDKNESIHVFGTLRDIMKKENEINTFIFTALEEDVKDKDSFRKRVRLYDRFCRKLSKSLDKRYRKTDNDVHIFLLTNKEDSTLNSLVELVTLKLSINLGKYEFTFIS